MEDELEAQRALQMLVEKVEAQRVDVQTRMEEVQSLVKLVRDEAAARLKK
jgi:hypothetical protein